MADDRAQLLQDIEQDVTETCAAGRRNNITDIVLSMGAIFASIIAAVLVAAKGVTPELVALTAGTAALPAAFGSLQQRVAFRERSLWYFQYGARARALAMELKYSSNPDVADFAKRRATIEVEMEEHWAQIGSGSNVVTSRKAKRLKTAT